MIRQAKLHTTPLAGLSQTETDQFTPLQFPLQPFRLIVNLWCKLDFKERATTNELTHEQEQKQQGEGAAGVASLGVSCYS